MDYKTNLVNSVKEFINSPLAPSKNSAYIYGKKKIIELLTPRYISKEGFNEALEIFNHNYFSIDTFERVIGTAKGMLNYIEEGEKIIVNEGFNIYYIIQGDYVSTFLTKEDITIPELRRLTVLKEEVVPSLVCLKDDMTASLDRLLKKMFF